MLEFWLASLVGKQQTIEMTEGKSVGGEAPSAPYGYCTLQALVRKGPTLNMTKGKSVGPPLNMGTVLKPW